MHWRHGSKKMLIALSHTLHRITLVYARKIMPHAGRAEKLIILSDHTAELVVALTSQGEEDESESAGCTTYAERVEQQPRPEGRVGKPRKQRRM